MPKQYGYIRMISKRQAEGIVAAKAHGKTGDAPNACSKKPFWMHLPLGKPAKPPAHNGAIMRHDPVEFSLSCGKTGIDAGVSDMQDKCTFPASGFERAVLKYITSIDAVLPHLAM